MLARDEKKPRDILRWGFKPHFGPPDTPLDWDTDPKYIAAGDFCCVLAPVFILYY